MTLPAAELCCADEGEVPLGEMVVLIVESLDVASAFGFRHSKD